jgi:hypothetical protein
LHERPGRVFPYKGFGWRTLLRGWGWDSRMGELPARTRSLPSY